MGYRIGIDAGSTTLKVVVLNENNEVIYKSYERHFSQVREKLIEQLTQIKDRVEGEKLKICLTGSAGYGIAKNTGISFVQEVFATAYLVKEKYPRIDAVIELGGEDAKIIFLSGGLEERMNSTCAGGTGAFIDQMAVLLNVTPQELDELSMKYKQLYHIASRCGVFAKSDIQPLLNQGAKKEDLSASIFQAVVDQTVAGLAQGRKIAGKVLFLGGPLFFYKGLQERFLETLKIAKENAIFPEDAQNFVAIGCAKYAGNEQKEYKYEEIIELMKIKQNKKDKNNYLPKLFKQEEDYELFKQRHNQKGINHRAIENWKGNAYLGIDAGSTTTKIVLINEEDEILYEYYSSNKGNPVEVIKEELLKIYEKCGERIRIRASGVTGYGEELIKSAFGVDVGIVETLAHFTAAKAFNKDVNFILDIGGQDIKCFKIQDGVIESILLNEACSSGCGSFIETFAHQMGYSVEAFAELALAADHPVDLGSRCTVFMNSSVKQAQKEGATIADVSAGLAISVVKNALYKVIRAKNAKELGKFIIVQGGTLLNDAILRSLELELGCEVIRPNVSGLMGAYGVALYAKEHHSEECELIKYENLLKFKHTSKPGQCKLCMNRCHLIINKFGEEGTYISGNRCEKPMPIHDENVLPNLYEYKYKRIRQMEITKGTKGIIGIPVVLNMYEMLPFWSSFFACLGFKVLLSDYSSKKLYRKGEYSIPSDTVCYPAKLVHGHIESLIDKGVRHIFYPCMSYNLDEGISDNTFNCPIVAYYPELIKANVERLKEIDFMYPYLSLNNKKVLVENLYKYLKERFDFITYKNIEEAINTAYEKFEEYKEAVRKEGKEALEYAKQHGKKVVVLAGRPYHIDPEINHGIDKVINDLGAVVVSEDSIGNYKQKPKVDVLNQWTYQARLYQVAYHVGESKDTNLIQLVSFGCGTDAITSDEIKDILSRHDKLYTQLKIDETSNLGAAKIRIRSMFASAQ
ncbi:MAG: acyl-CoA dehydratase activase-related protein [Cellulosilyticaceae bacterium]